MVKQNQSNMRFFLITLSIAMLPMITVAQRRGEVEDKSCVEATKIAKQAEKLWKDDQYFEAEKLYYKVLALCPRHDDLSEFAVRAIKMGDIKGANKVWYEMAKRGGNLEIVYYRMLDNNFKYGDIAVGIDASVKYLELYRGKKIGSACSYVFSIASLSAFNLGDIKSLQKINELSKTMDKMLGQNPKEGEFFTDVYIKIIDKQYAAAETLLKDAIENRAGFGGSRDWSRANLPYVYFAKGDFVKAEESVKDARENGPGIISKKILDQGLSNFYGFIALHKGEYLKASEQFSIFLNRSGLFGIKLREPAKFKYYTYRAEAYEGLKEFDKARKDYEAALVYNPDYEPAIIGLARLEGHIITERKTDKTPPLITITEPAVTRGLIVKAIGSDAMIKGSATDPGGLKSVTINGEKVYSQEGGTFWGNVTLKAGINKVTVSATDFSGNIGEQVFDIERPASASSVTAIPVKEGRNFALLIGCQNYDDNNILSLDNPIADAIKLKLILKNNYNYSDENIFTLFNPERSDFKKQFLELNENILPEDNLVIFYAGHGIWVEKEKKGYWLLTEAKINDVNTWLSNKEVLDMIARLPARHTLLITDACFSGSVFKTRGVDLNKKEGDAPSLVQQMNQKISRVAITSGNDTEVPDKSVFMKYLVKALSENKEKFLTAQKMFINQIIEAVMTETKTEPRYGTLELAGHVGGDFIFTKK